MTTVSSTGSSTSTSTASAFSTSSTSTTTTTSIDWDSLIDAAYQAKLAKATEVDTTITANEAKITAYENGQSLLQDLADAANALRAPTGTTVASDDVFKSRTAYLTANGDVTASDVLSATVDDGSDIGSYEITVSQLAKAEKVSSDTQTSRTTELAYDGVFSLAVDGGSTVDVTIDSGMTLDEVAEAINNTTDTSGVQASVIKVADSEYKLVLSASDTGKAITATAVSGTDVLNKLGITNSTGAWANELQASQDAIMSLDGVSVTRDSNDIDDLVDGVTFHLYQTTPTDTSVTVEVGTNLSTVETAVQSLVTAYNAYREYAVSQQATGSDGTASSDAVLYGDGTLRNINSELGSALTATVNSLSMASIGLSFDDNNELVLDTTTLESALLDDLDNVKSLLTFQCTPSSSDLMLLARGDSTPASFTLDISVDSSGSLSSVSVGGDTSLFTVSGSRIVGATGTAYEGLSFVYVGDTSQSISVTTSTGIAELLYNASDKAADTTDGNLQTLIDNLTDQDTTLQDRSDTLTARAESYKETITSRYAKYQAAIQEAQSMLTYLKTLLQSSSSS
ncbi:MAG: flagellar filament capping protein FliD [Rhodoplanes sp.]|uniref:flagellar filament capping protein FliD n=1 Tax=Rhodoplanes sp. TaxID=1968906 RepID=UPI0017F71925|nr:flagellar filament capping protein FliD [Rhodoplanes sp.]NVO16636.1 flagellar filament capping protein FliD [Rhodoplanes sp.]